MKNMTLVYVLEEKLDPWRFSLILQPHIATNIVMNTPPSQVKDFFNIPYFIFSRTRASPYQAGVDPRWATVEDIKYGKLVAIDEGCYAWSPARHSFYIDAAGKLINYSLEPGQSLLFFELNRRYEEMVRIYGRRPPATVMPPRQSTRSRATPVYEASAIAAKKTPQQEKALEEMGKRERWQERKYLIGQGERSVYPDARIAAKRLAKNNVAVEKAKLAANVYDTTDPLKVTPGVPTGWEDVSNDEGYLKKLNLTKEMLYDKADSPDFLARVYTPDRSIFGDDMSPTVVFRGSRAPGFPGLKESVSSLLSKGEIPPIKNAADWTNNIAQSVGREADYYKKSVIIGNRLSRTSSKVDIAGHSLGGGLASATSIASGKQAWTFNAAGLHPATVKKYGGEMPGSPSDIQAYRVKGELLTRLQEVDIVEDFKHAGVATIYPLIAKEGISIAAPDAAGIKHTLEGGHDGALARHGIKQVIDCIEKEKNTDIATIKNRL